MSSKHRIRLLVVATAALALAALVAFVAMTKASPASGVTATLIGRGTYPAYHLNTDSKSPIDFEAKTKQETDVVVQRHDYQPGATTGWHTHPGPVFITVISGTLTFYERDDPTCSPHVVSAGQGYVDTGMGHIGFNNTDQVASDVTVAIAPVGAPFRSELDAPGPYCNF
jgi:quercetin dioxygenase-like cupin family protein